ncbi:uncharacterized protein LOC125491950 [Beta vulgaris subsp. vulgaris]|uniref:uncharacterized protein LOC125491950 n=1 Tax=Beta vulgaris subsp. vulgaris TaxID=3555 RepID=UPI0020369F2F|nr:uncharacterized protein LOC125491950 [Beta vulgaris subsp. vulgaris]
MGAGTNWSTFTWRVVQRFRSREAFRDIVAHYAITQGTNLCFANSNKKKLLRLEAKCLPSCPFRVYGSWDKRRACFLVKAVNAEHCCSRNMTKNKQLKFGYWLARQLLEVFKSRPYWPGKEIQETRRQAYKVAIETSLAYRVKYVVHKMLHGSMKEHYNKHGRYLQAIQDADPNCHVDLCTLPSKQPGGPPIFQRLFICFSGLKKGWIEGCRKLLCIDSYFLKTFLAGQLMAAIGRDANEQMYLVLWAVVEGENSESWVWFMKNMQKCLQLGDGVGLTVISDENPALLTSVASVMPMSEHRH